MTRSRRHAADDLLVYGSGEQADKSVGADDPLPVGSY
jgi:hypothetical protein